MTTDYMNYILTELEKANEAWKKAMAEGRFEEAYIYGKRASDLEAIYHYHSNNTANM